ncbi:MAG: PilZ protein [Frankiales bacterium]|jgi:hypothetical protein|nr:PilZ protein [Frankiales bacterium]
MTRLPEAGTAVVLRDQAGGAHQARLVNVMEGHLGLLLDDPRGQVFDVSSRLLVTWPDKFGLVCLPCASVRLPDHSDTRLIVQVTGDSWREQRRQFQRASVTGVVGLRSPEQPSVGLVNGMLIDLSEAGLRCAIDERHTALREPKTLVTVVLDLDENELELPGKVLYGRLVAREDQKLEVVILFDRPVVKVELLRRHIEVFHPREEVVDNDHANVVNLSQRRGRRPGWPSA